MMREVDCAVVVVGGGCGLFHIIMWFTMIAINGFLARFIFVQQIHRTDESDKLLKLNS